MALIPDSVLADMRGVREDSFDQSCTISTPAAPTDDGAGGETDNAPTTAVVACRLNRPTGIEAVVAERLSALADRVVAVPHGTTIHPGGTVTVNGTAYEIVWTNQDRSHRTGGRMLVRRIG